MARLVERGFTDTMEARQPAGTAPRRRISC